MEGNPRIAGKLECSLLFHRKGGDIYCIGSRESDRYLSVRSEDAFRVYEALLLLDGSRTIEEAQREIGAKTYDGRTLDMKELYEIARKAEIVVGDYRQSKHSHDETDLALIDIGTVHLERMSPFFSFTAQILPAVALIGVFLFAFAILCVVQKNDGLTLQTLLTNPMTLIWMWVIQVPSILLHELSHAAVAYKLGAKPQELSVCVFYYIGLALYVRIPGIYFLPPWKRILIWISGIAANLILAALFVVVYQFSPSVIQLPLSVGIIVNLLIIINNLIPLMYSDGYYILSTILKVPNLRKNSLFGFKRLVRNGIKKETMSYWVYVLATVSVFAVVFGIQVSMLVEMLLHDISAGLSIAELICHYRNIIFLLAIGIVARFARCCKKPKIDTNKFDEIEISS